MGKMHYRRFFSFNVIGGVAWISLFLFMGYFVGGFQFVQDNIKTICIIIIILSICPAIYEYIKEKIKSKKEKSKEISE